MFSKSFISVLIVTSAFTFVFGQTPETKSDKQGAAVTAFTFSFDGDGSYLGIQTEEISKENFSKYALRSVTGVAIEKVIENSPAAAAGLQNGDVIVRFNGDEVTSTRKLTRLLSEVAPDHQVRLTISRGGAEQEITVTLAKRPMPKFEPGNFTFRAPAPMGKMEIPRVPAMPRGDFPRVFNLPPGDDDNTFVWRAGAGRQIGVSGYSLSKQLGERFGVEAGVLINNVREDSPAAKAGLRAGDVIVEIDGKAVKSEFDMVRSINAKKEGDVTLTIVRDRARQTISVTPEASKDGGFFFQTDEDGAPMPSPTALPAVAPRPMVRMSPMTMPSPAGLPSPMSLPRIAPTLMSLGGLKCII
jgi:serine protease Do